MLQLTDFDYVIAALANALYSGLTLEEILETTDLCENGVEFDAAIEGLISLNSLLKEPVYG